MQKHEVSYHDHSNNISFLFYHCNHLRAFKRFFLVLAIQIKKILQKTKKEKNNFQLIRILKRNEKIKSFLVEDEQINSSEIVISSKKKKKRKKSKKVKSIVIETIDSKIYIIEAASFHLLIKQKRAEIFALFSREIDV
jgi:hypothetical protein